MFGAINYITTHLLHVVIWMNKIDSNGKPAAADFVTAYVADNSIKKIRNSPKWSWNEGEK